ncbi:phospholipase/carboxylesterase family protein-like protein [Lentithecium fluviatile CBS 122367]|uniref:Phospholipase/carboxylesterase family protein-like protein n=1 Tax=Lentithecium fluviatile CBS 122367 TaxID=1168545 RepID=A0A6G1JFJ2_9PLEO|nr:phospholipase/carboxylesterase family protein-like protein [Lentithecium fluviatile CBS 122367]
MTTTTPTPENIHVIPPTTPHAHTVIFLHGRGINATEFASELFESQASYDRFFTDIFPGVKWVFPCAAKRWAETEQEQMCQWFDMASVQHPDERVDIQKPGIRDSVLQILEVLQAESAEVGAERVFLVGISQGCATAILALLVSNVKIGGFVGLCGWFPLREELEKIPVETTSAPKSRMKGLREIIDMPTQNDPAVSNFTSTLHTPVLLQHTEDDSVVPMTNGYKLVKSLREFGMHVDWQCFGEGGHWLNEPAGMDGIVAFLQVKMASG